MRSTALGAAQRCSAADATARAAPQAQHRWAKPVAANDLRRQAIAPRVEHLDGQIPHHSALTGKPPALLTLFSGQGLGQCIFRLALYAAHQARMTTAGAATVRNRHAGMVQGVEQIAGRGHRPATLTHMQLRHSDALRRK
ncbi:hypothetical protein A242_17837 [Pseudomonas syringae pv. actinidiae ICMP 19095]|nr:hypothetical protein A242_17837 [Pseudomonas syringae pv. actinidiae ICMP 19095]